MQKSRERHHQKAYLALGCNIFSPGFTRLLCLLWPEISSYGEFIKVFTFRKANLSIGCMLTRNDSYVLFRSLYVSSSRVFFFSSETGWQKVCFPILFVITFKFLFGFIVDSIIRNYSNTFQKKKGDIHLPLATGSQLYQRFIYNL